MACGGCDWSEPRAWSSRGTRKSVSDPLPTSLFIINQSCSFDVDGLHTDPLPTGLFSDMLFKPVILNQGKPYLYVWYGEITDHLSRGTWRPFSIMKNQ